MAASTSSATTATSRFASLNADEFDLILLNKDAENTKKATRQAVAIFRDYLKEKSLPGEFETLDKLALGSVLAKFYVEVRRSDGEFYKRTTLNSIRAGINRHLKSEHEHIIDIIKDVEFARANAAYKAATVQLKRLGKGDVQHHNAIDESDIRKLYGSEVFDHSTPVGLQYKVWFELMLFICRRGRENLRELKKGHFKIQSDANGRQYVTQAIDELTTKT